MPILKGNLHAHTTFSDGRQSLAAVLEQYRALGYDWLAITDHEDRISEDYWFALPGRDTGLLVLHGVELDYRPLSQHVGRVHGERETLHVLNHPARYNLSVAETLRRIAVLRAAGLAIDAVEVTDTGLYQPRYDVEAIALPKVATDDSHRSREVGRAWIEVDAVERTADAIIRAIRAGAFRMGFALPADPREGRGWDLLGLAEERPAG